METVCRMSVRVIPSLPADRQGRNCIENDIRSAVVLDMSRLTGLLELTAMNKSEFLTVQLRIKNHG